MKKLLITIWAYDYHTKFEILANDNAKDVENAILDKLGENSIKWEYMGNVYSAQPRITFEEVINDTGPVQKKTVLGVEVATGAPR